MAHSKGYDINQFGAQNAARIAEALGQSQPAKPAGKRAARNVGADGMDNPTEKAYCDYLAMRLLAGEILWYQPKPAPFRLAHRCQYHADFLVLTTDGFEVHEVKGFMEDDAAVKLRVFKDKYPQFGLVIVRKKGGEWKFERR